MIDYDNDEFLMEGFVQEQARINKAQVEDHSISSNSSSQLINSVGPDFSIPFQHTGSHNMGGSHIQQFNAPDLFGEDQFKDGFGPVYAIPTYPWHDSQDGGNNPTHTNLELGMDYANSGQPSKDYSLQNQAHQHESAPGLFGENQFKDGFGPVYANPTYPWHHNQGQSLQRVHWPQGYVYPQVIPAFYMYPFCTCSTQEHKNHE